MPSNLQRKQDLGSKICTPNNKGSTVSGLVAHYNSFSINEKGSVWSTNCNQIILHSHFHVLPSMLWVLTEFWQKKQKNAKNKPEKEQESLHTNRRDKHHFLLLMMLTSKQEQCWSLPWISRWLLPKSICGRKKTNEALVKWLLPYQSQSVGHAWL